MNGLVQKRSGKAAYPPGTMVHIGERKVEAAKITLTTYDEEGYREEVVASTENLRPDAASSVVTWVSVDGLHDTRLIEELGANFSLHPLLLEDIVNTEQRPKMDDYEGYVFLVIKALSADDRHGTITAEQISIVIGKNYVISFQEKEMPLLDPLRERLKNSKGRIRKLGADFLAYSIVDAVVDNYFLALENLGERIETVEEELVTKLTKNIVRTVHALKKDILLCRRFLWPMREMIGSLQRAAPPGLFQESTFTYLRDVHDHVTQIIDTMEVFRDTLSGVLDIYLSTVSNKLNEIMKVLTIIATIFMPLTFIAGVYGMNFRYMPELEWRSGYFLCLLLMLGVSISMLVYFRTRKWL
jgi:magnesium transporter